MRRLYIICALLLLLLLFMNLLTGPVVISAKTLLSILFSPLSLHISQSYNMDQYAVIWQLRLPRLLAVILVGASLGISGAVMQNLFRNPLADPALLGVASGSSLMMMLLILFAGTLLSPIFLPIAAFFGGFLIVVLLYMITQLIQPGRVALVLLGGIAINALLAGAMNGLLYLSDSEQLQRIVGWSFGGIVSMDWSLVRASGFVMILGVGLLFSQRKALNVWALGEAEAVSLGLNSQLLIACCLIGVAMVVGVSVAVAGPIGFVGLVVPHIARFWTGALAERLLMASALLGACLLLFADWLCHVVHPPSILPLGIATAFFGAPAFIILLIKYRAKI